MLIKVKQFWGFLFLLVLSLIYIGIYLFKTGASKPEVTEIYFADRITAAHKVLIERYNKLYEGIVKVVPIDFPNNDFISNERKELLARSLRGRGDGIDLFAVDLIWVQRFTKWCEPLDKYLTSNEKNEILDYALESCYYDGELVAVPLNLVQGVMYYREDLLLQLDGGAELINKINNNITWKEFISISKKYNYDKPFYIFPATDYEGLICSFAELILSLDPNYYENNGFNFNTPEAEKSLNLLVDLVNTYSVAPNEVTDMTEVPSYKYFIENDYLFLRGWQSYDKDFLQEPFNPIKEKNLRKAQLPHFEEGKTISIFGGWNLMMSKFSDKKDEVIKFIKFLLSETSQELIYRESGYYPIIKSFYNNKELLQKYPQIKEFKKMHKFGVHRPAHVDYTKFSKIMSHYFELAIKNEISVKEALKQSTHDIRHNKVLLREF